MPRNYPQILLRRQKVKPRATARNFQKQFHHADGGSQRLEALIFANSPKSWLLQK